MLFREELPSATQTAEVFPTLLIRVPLLPYDVVSCDCFREVRALQLQFQMILAAIDTEAGATISAIERAVPVTHRRHRSALLRIKRALYNKNIPRLRDVESLGGDSLNDLATELDRLAKQVRELSNLGMAAKAAFRVALQRADRDTMAHLARASFQHALSLSNPSVLEQATRHAVHKAEGSRPLRRTARTLRRLLWRAAARPTPLGLYASTGVAHLGSGSLKPNTPLGRLIACSLRPEAAKAIRAEVGLDPAFPDDADLSMLEGACWAQALKVPELVPTACTVSQWREAADSISTGCIPTALPKSIARALFIESALADAIDLPASQLAPALDIVARFGSASVVATDAPRISRLRQVFEDWYGRDRSVPFSAFSARLSAQMLAAPYPPNSETKWSLDVLFDKSERHVPSRLQEMVAMSFVGKTADICLSEESLAAISLPLSMHQRVCLRFRHAGYIDGNWVLLIKHWGGDRMSFLPRYALLPGVQFSNLGQNFAAWMAQWPAQTDIDLGLTLAVERRPSMTTRAIKLDDDHVNRKSLRLADLGVTAPSGSSGLVVRNIHTGQTLDPVYLGVLAENILPFEAQLLLAISPRKQTSLEAVIDAINEQVGLRITEARDCAVALPRVRLGAYLELLPFSVFLPKEALRSESLDSLETCRMVWALLDTFDCPCGLTEIRFVDVLKEPIVLDLGHPDGVTWLIALVRERGAVLIVPLASHVPLDLDGLYLAELCCELRAA